MLIGCRESVASSLMLVLMLVLKLLLFLLIILEVWRETQVPLLLLLQLLSTDMRLWEKT